MGRHLLEWVAIFSKGSPASQKVRQNLKRFARVSNGSPASQMVRQLPKRFARASKGSPASRMVRQHPKWFASFSNGSPQMVRLSMAPVTSDFSVSAKSIGFHYIGIFGPSSEGIWGVLRYRFACVRSIDRYFILHSCLWSSQTTNKSRWRTARGSRRKCQNEESLDFCRGWRCLHVPARASTR